MLDGIRVLQLGIEDWSKSYEIPSCLDFVYAETIVKEPRYMYDLVFVERELTERECEILMKSMRAYTLYYVEGIGITETMKNLFEGKVAAPLRREQIGEFLLHEARNYYSKAYGEKFSFQKYAVIKDFAGSIVWNGNYSVQYDGEYGDEYRQIGFWRNNIPVFKGQAIDLWLEYKKDETVDLALSITQFKSGSISTIQQKWFFSGDEVEQVMIIDNQMATGPIFVSLMAKGSGKLELVALHDRYSRRGHGDFYPGGQRYVTSKREEIFYYFDPGDRKPPLNVYFSGYKTMQGFEGYYMMRKMGCPFLLIGEPRLEGGSFYMGDEEYENGMVEVIRHYMDRLGFSEEEVILSGMSMGSFGALYYGCDIKPHTMILGKPLASIGDVAMNERLHRPGGFPTSLDVLNYVSKGTDKEAADRLNHRFWDKFDNTEWKNSRFVVSYMIEDDYDSKAYNRLISHLKSGGIEVYGKGIHGRHNDATGAIAGWFKNQYEKTLNEHFGRRI